ncbi:MAG: hypothetical protein KC897_03740 [Candidatus Omnitrophica bacterium]|nr:hypothetical protein [Candidatus Omnitrophota bacterium]MCB9721689.1 hypothetical protein [Candidatus Omnitrophota bacterium]
MKKIPTQILFVICFAATFVIVGFGVLISDYSAYRKEKKWYARLQQDLPVGTPERQVRQYLFDQGPRNGIRGLQEVEEFGIRRFVFDNHNRSHIIALMKRDNQSLLEDAVVVELDEHGKLRDIYSRM